MKMNRHSPGQLQTNQSEKNTFSISKPAVACIIAALLALAFLYVYASIQQEKERVYNSVQDKANVLFWALEGSARAVTMHRSLPLSAELLSEIANQPGISSICLLNKEGKILIHSEPTGNAISVAPHYKEVPFLQTLLDNPSTSILYTSLTGAPTLEVIKLFAPNIKYRMHPMRHKRQHMMERFKNSELLFVVVSFDQGPINKNLAEYTKKSIFISLLFVLVSISFLLLLYVRQRYLQSRRLLKDVHALATQLVTNLPIGLIVTDLDGNIVLYNNQTVTLLRLDKKVTPINLYELPLLNWQELTESLAKGDVIFEQEIEIPHKKTELIALSLSAAKILDSDQKTTGYLFILRDLHEVRNLQKQVRLNERLSALGSMAAGVAHEIRNPLSTLKGYATFLSSKLKHDEKAYATGKLMIAEVERLNRVVSDLLSVARPGQLSLHETNICDVVARAIRLIEMDVESKKITITNSCTPSTLMADSDRLVQALLNILLNSVQATTAGKISITVEPDTTEKNIEQSAIIIRIRDTGCGMDKETLANLFTPYFTTKASGSGLGMTITHQIIEQHSGTITVTSEIGKGSVFTLSLPQKRFERE